MKYFNRSYYTAEKIHDIFLYSIRFILLVAIAAEIWNRSWLTLFVSVLAFLLTFLPAFIEKRFKIDIPVELEIITVVFIYASIFLGELRSYYTRYWWWDALLHTSSGIALGFVGFMILYVLYRGDKIRASPSVVAFFAFCFALAMGALWEIFEFAMDQIFGFNMQKNGLIDTMWDLIVDSLGALIASVIGYLYLKSGKMRFFDRIMKKFEKDNPGLFKEKAD